MSELAFFNGLTIGFLVVAAMTFVALRFITAPYGRHSRGGWGPAIPRTAGWVLMEFPAVFCSLFFLFIGGRTDSVVVILLTAMWQVHYINRTFVFPFRMRGGVPVMPLSIALMGFVFNGFNGYLNGRWINTLSPGYPVQWLYDPRFLAGAALFFLGLFINWQSDAIVRNLRRPGEAGYKIPFGGCFRVVSSPNYLGELLEWTGWAIATWSMAGLAFALWTAANLAPRAANHHRWYQETFPDYPRDRKVLIPWVW